MFHPSRVAQLFLFVAAALVCVPAVAAACTCVSQPCGSVTESGTLFEGTVESIAPAATRAVGEAAFVAGDAEIEIVFRAPR